MELTKDRNLLVDLVWIPAIPPEQRTRLQPWWSRLGFVHLASSADDYKRTDNESASLAEFWANGPRSKLSR